MNAFLVHVFWGTVTRDGAERVSEISDGDAATPNRGTSVGKLRSVVWEYFTIADNGNPDKAKCTL